LELARKTKYSTLFKQYKEDKLANGYREMIEMNTNFMNLLRHQVGLVMKYVIASISDVELMSSQS
jgi:hypothetical protein